MAAFPRYIRFAFSRLLEMHIGKPKPDLCGLSDVVAKDGHFPSSLDSRIEEIRDARRYMRKPTTPQTFATATNFSVGHLAMRSAAVARGG